MLAARVPLARRVGLAAGLLLLGLGLLLLGLGLLLLLLPRLPAFRAPLLVRMQLLSPHLGLLAAVLEAAVAAVLWAMAAGLVQPNRRRGA